MAGVLPGLGVGVTAFAPACSGVRRASSTATGAFPCAPTPPRAAGPPAPHAVTRRGCGARCHAAGAAACPPAVPGVLDKTWDGSLPVRPARGGGGGRARLRGADWRRRRRGVGCAAGWRRRTLGRHSLFLSGQNSRAELRLAARRSALPRCGCCAALQLLPAGGARCAAAPPVRRRRRFVSGALPLAPQPQRPRRHSRPRVRHAGLRRGGPAGDVRAEARRQAPDPQGTPR